MSGVGRLVVLGLRTGWAGLLAVAVVASGLVTVVAGSVDALYPDHADRLQYAESIGASPATQAFNGIGHDLTTTGGITVVEVGFMGQLLFPALALAVALRHTRRPEEAGLTELLTATRVGRLAPLGAGWALVLLSCAATSVLMLLGLVAVGLPPAGSAWYVAGTGLLMASFGTLGLLLGQLAQSTRTAQLIGLGLVMLAFLVRALVDGFGLRAPWAGPLAWLAEVRPFGDPQTWPLLAYASSALLLLLLAAGVARRRDLGAGVIAPRPGPPRARSRLGTVTGAAWRVTRPVVLAWTLFVVVWSACLGALTREMTSLVEANPGMLEGLGFDRAGDIITSLAVVAIVLGATAVAVQGSERLGVEESSDRLGMLLATSTPRTRWWSGWWAVVAGSAVGVLLAGVLALGVSSWAVTGDGQALWSSLAVGLGYAVPVLFVVATAAALRAVAPRAAALAWVLVGWIVLVGFLAETLRIPGWARDLSPLHLVGSLPREDPSLVATAGLALAGALLFAGSTVAFRRRDLRVV